MIMASLNISKTLVLVFACLLSFTGEAAVTYLYYDCPNTTTFTPNGTYHHNLNSLLSSFTSNATGGNGFYNLTLGQGSSDIIHGLFLCRGDVTKNICQECVTTAAKEILHRCPREKVALITYDECMLRYSSRDFFSSVQREPSLQLLNTQEVSEPERFMDLLVKTMNNVTAQAADDPSGKRFATAEANFSSFQKLYTLAQCTQDLSVGSCNECLQAAVGYLPSCCNGKQGGRVVFPSCNVRYELYQFYRVVAPPPSTALLPSNPSPEQKGRRKISSVIIIAIVVPIFVSVMLFAMGICLTRTRKGSSRNDAVPDQSVGNEITTTQPLQLDLAAIQTATNNFSADNKLGEGGYGKVYKGRLPNGQDIAVKILTATSSEQGAEAFKNEAATLAMLQHRNLVRLLGFCLEAKEQILIYEFVPNKSLDYFLFETEKQRKLDWPRRYKIIEGIARGIQYLHEDSRLKIIHRDLKASKVLLDEKMSPKISDFGMARIFNVDQSQAKTDRVIGTFGYMAPEYAMHGQFSVKSDIYSFGVLVLEIISGRKNSSFCQTDGAEGLLSYIWNHWRNGTPTEVLDPTMMGSCSRNEVLRCIQIGLLCVQDDPADRPTMSTVVLMLSSYSISLSAPQKPAFLSKGLESDQSASKSVPCSVDEESITGVHTR